MERLSHVCFNVKDLEKSIKFYMAIGMKHAFDFKSRNKKRFGVYLKSGKGTFVEMFQLDKKGKKQYKPNSNMHLCFQVRDINEVARMLKRKRIKQQDRFKWGEFGELIFVSDPDGNKVEFSYYSKKNPLLKHMK